MKDRTGSCVNKFGFVLRFLKGVCTANPNDPHAGHRAFLLQNKHQHAVKKMLEECEAEVDGISWGDHRT